MAKYRKEDLTSFALGTTLTIELLKKRPDLARRLYISPAQRKDETYEKLVHLARAIPIPVIENNVKIFKELSEKENVMAIGEFEKKEAKLDSKENHVVLVHPSNQGNIGTILRACAGFSILNVAMIKPCGDVFDPKTVRSSMGALFNLNVQLFSSFEDYQNEYGNRTLHPFMLQAKDSLVDCQKNEPYSLIFGNEARGLDPEFLSIGKPLIIPQSGLIDSLNLDNAVSIALYEFNK